MASTDPVNTLCHRSSRSEKASSSLASNSCAAVVGCVGTRRERASSVRVSYSAMIRRSTRRANMMNRRGHHGARHDAAGHKGRQSHADDRAETSQLMRM